MTPQTLKAVNAILDADPTVADVHRKLVIRVCRNPEVEAHRTDSRGKTRFLTAREVADMLSVTQRTVWRMVERGQLSPAKISRRFTRFRVEQPDQAQFVSDLRNIFEYRQHRPILDCGLSFLMCLISRAKY